MTLTKAQTEHLGKLAHNASAMESMRTLADDILSTDNILNEAQAESDEIIGQRVRGMINAKKMLDDFFSTIESYKTVEKLEEEDNPVK